MIEKEISGKKVGFRFGTYTLKLIRELTGTQSIEEVFYGIANKRPGKEDPLKEEPLRTELEHMEFIQKFLFACAKHAAASNNYPGDFKEANVCDWIDEMGLVESMSLISDLIKSYTTKNLKAPETGQVEQP